VTRTETIGDESKQSTSVDKNSKNNWTVTKLKQSGHSCNSIKNIVLKQQSTNSTSQLEATDEVAGMGGNNSLQQSTSQQLALKKAQQLSSGDKNQKATGCDERVNNHSTAMTTRL